MSPFDPATIPSSGDSFPAAWEVTTAGALNVTLLTDVSFLRVFQAVGAVSAAINLLDGDGDSYFRAQPASIQVGLSDALPTGVTVQSAGTKLWGDANNDNNYVIHVKAGDKLGFFGTAPVVKPNVGAVPTALSIATALVALGLVSSS